MLTDSWGLSWGISWAVSWGHTTTVSSEKGGEWIPHDVHKKLLSKIKKLQKQREREHGLKAQDETALKSAMTTAYDRLVYGLPETTVELSEIVQPFAANYDKAKAPPVQAIDFAALMDDMSATQRLIELYESELIEQDNEELLLLCAAM